jgi:acyl carrier protein
MDNSSATVPAASVAERVFQIVAEEAEQPREAIDRETNLGGDVFDSLGVVELIMALEDEFEISIPDDDAEQIHTVGQLIDAIESRLAAATREGTSDAAGGDRHAPPSP